MEIDDGMDEGCLDGWCYECGDEFHLDDTGGYNPPCPCGCGRCRDCCDDDSEPLGDDDDYDPRDDEREETSA